MLPWVLSPWMLLFSLLPNKGRILVRLRNWSSALIGRGVAADGAADGAAEPD